MRGMVPEVLTGAPTITAERVITTPLPACAEARCTGKLARDAVAARVPIGSVWLPLRVDGSRGIADGSDPAGGSGALGRPEPSGDGARRGGPRPAGTATAPERSFVSPS